MANKLIGCCEIYCYLCLTLGFVFFLVLYIMADNQNEFFLEEKAKGVDARAETMNETFYTAIVSITNNILDRMGAYYNVEYSYS